MMANENTSAITVYSLPSSTSGAMYSGVPILRVIAAEDFVGAIAFDVPKSAILLVCEHER